MDFDFWDAVAVALKTVLYGATFAASGGAVFLVYAAQLAQEQRRRIARGVYGCAIAAVLFSAARVAGMSAAMSGDWTGLWDLPMERMVLDSGEGRALFMRLIGLACIVMMVGRAGTQMRADRNSGIGLVTGAVFASTSFGWVGHVHAANMALPVGVCVLIDVVLCLHLLSVAFWVGALPPLLMLSRQLGPLELGTQAARFGVIAVRVVGLLMAAGAGLAVLLLMPWHNSFWGNSYVWLLGAKLIAVALLLALAALNRQRLTPRLQRGDPNAVRSLRYSIAAEVVVAFAILAITAALTTLTGPPRTTDNGTTQHSIDAHRG